MSMLIARFGSHAFLKVAFLLAASVCTCGGERDEPRCPFVAEGGFSSFFFLPAHVVIRFCFILYTYTRVLRV